MEQECAAGLTERQVAEFVEDHEVGMHRAVCHLALFAVRLLEFQGIDEVDGLEEPHPVAVMLDRLDAERGGE